MIEVYLVISGDDEFVGVFQGGVDGLDVAEVSPHRLASLGGEPDVPAPLALTAVEADARGADGNLAALDDDEGWPLRASIRLTAASASAATAACPAQNALLAAKSRFRGSLSVSRS